MALALYCIASHCIPIISPINPSPLRRKRQFYFCLFIFPFSSFRAAAASSQCVSLQHHVTSTQPKTSNNNEIDQKERRGEGKGQKEEEKKDFITTNEPPFLKENTLISHIPTCFTVTPTTVTPTTVQYSQYTSISPSPSPTR